MPKHKISLKCFNTDLHITLNTNKDFDKIKNTLTSTAYVLHNTFNIYDENSEISKLNIEKKIIPSTYLKDILQTAIKYETLTNYHFNTNQSFKEINNITFENEYIKIQDKIDLGGIAKGYFMLLIKNFLNNKNLDYQIDFGGSLLFENKTTIKLRDIHNHTKYILQLDLQDKECIHTSSFYFQTNGENSHIHQKNSGYKQVNKSISVIDDNPVLADALSTAIYSMDFEYAMDFISKYKLKIIYILENTIYISSNISNYNLLQNHSQIKTINLK